MQDFCNIEILTYTSIISILVPFLLDPTKAETGFGIGLQVMFDSNIDSYKEPKYVLDTGGVLGQGVSIFVSAGQLYAIVTTSGSMWQGHELSMVL